ncbi:hypothetical protein Sipo8835_10185 [Streptomyces ipomoeae]|uniref:Uncharacterized protein n=1 Tax=Streptomyces ipomoeae TaxID=103232 RepID=A0AAE9B220_9ACTN|nr:DUF6271 family protein [Streptomyces ipomoeae]TQE36242.1 hypothetical protein Sipo7851_12690 [Streptomyces ipomoeae]TQE36488.1 hypothetical protein Sipo8835_10185 [Streptomyces ipomoeae]
MQSVLHIPTNRDTSIAIASYVKEVRYAREEFGKDIPLVLIETDNGDQVAHNARALEQAKAQDPDLTLYHMTIERQGAYFAALLEGEPERVRNVFSSRAKNYATAMNKLFLMTPSFGADMFHRRDSDTTLLSDHLDGIAPRYPIEPELRYLGARVGSVASTGDAERDDRRIWVVGGNYFGEWNIDVKDFARRDFGIVHRLYELLGFERSVVEEICAEAFQFDPVYEEVDELNFVTSVNDGLNPDCANFGMYRLHEYLPAVPGDNMLAADYFQFDIATALGIPALNHGRPVFHQYEPERFDPTRKLSYWEGMARFADYFNFYYGIFTGDLSTKLSHDDGDGLPAELSAEIVETSRRQRLTLDKKERAARIKRIAEEILIPFDENYAAIGRQLVERADLYVTQCDAAYETHELLLERWPRIIERAKQISLPKTLSAR